MEIAIETESGKIAVKIEDIDVRANGIVGGDEGRLSRYFEEGGRTGNGGIWTAGDKRKVMDEMVKASTNREDIVRVYVGDSMTDLGCLLAADVGICVRDVPEDHMSNEQRQLKQTLERLEIHCSTMDLMRLAEPRNMIRRGSSIVDSRLLWTGDLGEICQSSLVDVTGLAKKSIRISGRSSRHSHAPKDSVHKVYKIYLLTSSNACQVHPHDP